MEILLTYEFIHCMEVQKMFIITFSEVVSEKILCTNWVNWIIYARKFKKCSNDNALGKNYMYSRKKEIKDSWNKEA